MGIGSVALEGVWKKFRYGEVHNRLRDVVPDLARRAFGRRRTPDIMDGEFWAVRDVSFSLGPGDALGIIGPNGAGKSTVLKLLTRILRPTLGSCRTTGRVGAIIDVAAGFHPDLTGRENVYLQGAIMGMSRREIAAKFDEIVAFSGIEWFLDTPVKRYSSGMHARLGFAIAAHLDPDVLIIDEVLAVGDAAFQRQAFARITDMVRRAIPVVVVSHQLESIPALCNRAMLLRQGEVIREGSPSDCIAEYLRGLSPAPADAGQSAVTIETMEISPGPTVSSGERARVTLRCVVRHPERLGAEGVGVRIRAGASGELLFETTTLHLGTPLPSTARFAVDLSLRVNTRPGVLLVESFVWDRMAGKPTGPGPTAQLEVAGNAAFEGPVQMSPECRVSPSA